MPSLRTIGFIALALALITLVNFYVHRRTTFVFALGRRGKVALGVGLGLTVAVMVFTRVAERWLGPAAAAAIGVTASAIEFSVLLSFALLMLVDLVRGLMALARRARHRLHVARQRKRAPTEVLASAREDDAIAVDLSIEPAVAASLPPPFPALGGVARREFLTRAVTGGALALGGGTAVYGAFFGRHDYRVETVPVRIAGLPRTLDGFTIVQISDIHFGTYSRGDEVRVASELIRRARPDLVVITGDMIDHDDAFTPYLGQLIERVAGAARHGVVAIPGNHDYYTGVANVLATARRAGARVLVNEGRVIGDAGGGFALLGVDDLWMRREGGGPDLARAIATVPRDLPRVLLCHNPAFFPEASASVALQLSGHTHGGQVNVGAHLTEYVLPFGYVAGLYQRDDAALYVNRGFGTAGPPTRIGSPPEITRIVLVAA